MNFVRRTNPFSGLIFFVKQFSSLSTALPHRAQPLCMGCSHRQLLPHTATVVTHQNLKPAGFNLYVCCTDFINFNEFVKVAGLPDTFNSWFLLLQLHMWMVSVKFSQMGREGVLLKQYFYLAMWQNVEHRLAQFEDLLSSERRDAVKNYYSLMFLSIMYYDEGIIGNDKTLANSLWTQLYGMDPNLSADKLELMVEYVRKQVHHHDNLDPGPIMRPGYISFLPLVGDKLNKAKADRDFQIVASGRQQD